MIGYLNRIVEVAVRVRVGAEVKRILGITANIVEDANTVINIAAQA